MSPADLPPLDGPDDPWARSTSPDGAYVWRIDAEEHGPSHWVMGGELWQRSPATRLFVAPRGWSFEAVRWEPGGGVRFEARRYPGRMPGLFVTLDAAARRGWLEVQARERALPHTPVPPLPDGPTPFVDLEAWLAAYPRE